VILVPLLVMTDMKNLEGLVLKQKQHVPFEITGIPLLMNVPKQEIDIFHIDEILSHKLLVLELFFIDLELVYLNVLKFENEKQLKLTIE